MNGWWCLAGPNIQGFQIQATFSHLFKNGLPGFQGAILQKKTSFAASSTKALSLELSKNKSAGHPRRQPAQCAVAGYFRPFVMPPELCCKGLCRAWPPQ